MDVIYDNQQSDRFDQGAAITIGAFDGVHRGHRQVIKTLKALAAERGLRTVVVTFDRHPASIVRPESAPLLLTDLDQKLELLAECGVDATFVVRFDEQRALQTAAEFVAEDLVGLLNAKLITVGSDFHFGTKRAGNVALLVEMGVQLGFETLAHELVDLNGQPSTESVSSTRIRGALRGGDLESANAMLGRPHEVRGIVGHGDGRARDLGFRTANLAIPETICLPADGIYAGWCRTPDGVNRACAISLGRRPTFYEFADTSLLEAHLIDFDADLYGEELAVQFVAHLRDELKFDSIDALIAQMGKDVDQCRTLLLG
ncbi:MAG: bifunctional riboflavin kinase/FAD synthetase [Actinobacteria bacterium]|uniref:Bifunctional riboflavin kinase/FMN adenylyltransferase n=1 Tax=freshwater metagenome TaxID=449393 RepID=A0A6J6ARQ9_9ZZZZ|nr:bifunctional riboflavin kinase/FAD synthetase [Actinomycetota bacterium]